MNRRNLGFRGDEKELSVLEKRFGFVFVEREKEPYSPYLNELATLYVNNSVAWGVYRGLNENGHYILFPSVLSEYVPKNLEDQKETELKRYWETTKPEYFDSTAVTAIGPVRKAFLEKLVGQKICWKK